MRRSGTGWSLNFPGARRLQATDDGVRFVRQAAESVPVPDDLPKVASLSDPGSWVLVTRCPGCGTEAAVLPYGAEFVAAFERAVESRSIRGIVGIPTE